MCTKSSNETLKNPAAAGSDSSNRRVKNKSSTNTVADRVLCPFYVKNRDPSMRSCWITGYSEIAKMRWANNRCEVLSMFRQC